MNADKLFGTKTGASKLFGEQWKDAKKKPSGMMGMFHGSKHDSNNWEKARKTCMK